jgi:hypothetical protein
LHNAANFEDIVIKYKLSPDNPDNDPDHEYETQATGSNGRVNVDIVIPGLPDGTTEASLHITDMYYPDGRPQTADFATCLGLPEPHTDRSCHDIDLESGLYPLNYTYTIVHIPDAVELIRIVDTNSVKVSGKVNYELGGSPCGIKGVAVRAFRTGTGPSVVVGETETRGDGKFDLPIPVNTMVRFEFDYFNHSFVAGKEDGTVTNDFLRGDTVNSAVEALVFTDVTTSLFTIETGVSSCGFPINHEQYTNENEIDVDAGFFEVDITSKQCPDFSKTYKCYENTCEIDLPAHPHTWGAPNFNTIPPIKSEDNWQIDKLEIDQQFQYKFPETIREFDLTEKTHTITFVFHPIPEMVVSVVKGEILNPSRSKMRTKCGDDAYFDFAVESNAPLELSIEFRTRYDDRWCYQLPTNSTLKVGSNLGVDTDPCDSSNDGGCELYPTTEVPTSVDPVTGETRTEDPKTTAKRTIVSGNPVFVENGGSVSAYVGNNNVEVSLYNERHISTTEKWGESVKMRLLVLGHLYLTADTVVTYFNSAQDFMPLLYVYAPPRGMGTSTVTMDMDVEISKSSVASTDREDGGKAIIGLKTEFEVESCIGIGAAVCFDTVKGEASEQGGVTGASTKNLAFSDSVHTEVSAEGLSLTTGADGDAVMLEGSVAKFITSQHVWYNVRADQCKIDVVDSTLWGAEHTSLVFYSRPTVEREMGKLEKTVRDNGIRVEMYGGSLSEEEKETIERRTSTAAASVVKWTNLLDHWDTDRRQAKNNPVDIRAIAQSGTTMGGEGVINRVTFDSSEISLTRSSSFEDTSVLDYRSSSEGAGVVYERGGFLGVGGGGVVVGPTFEGGFELMTTYSRESRTDQTTSNQIVHEVQLEEPDSGDALCLAIYESPHSKGMVMEVCGGETMCPHVPGTDPREVFDVRVDETPPVVLAQDAGQIKLKIETNLQRVDEMNIVLELDAETALAPVSFAIGGSSLGQALEYTLEKRDVDNAYPLTILFERLDPSLESIIFVLTVRSACDESIFKQISFTLKWASSCPSVAWGGSLQREDAKFELSLNEPDLAISSVNPSGTAWRDAEGLTVDVAAWAKLYDYVNAKWFKIPFDELRQLQGRNSEHGKTFVDQETNGGAALWLSADDNQLFRDETLYLLELRTTCTRTISGQIIKVGETRSGQRLGVVDTAGPLLISLDQPRNVKTATLGFPVARFGFNEAIDCTHPALKAVVNSPNKGKLGLVYCTANGRIVNVVLQMDSEEEKSEWSNSQTTVELNGVRDVFGNEFRGPAPKLDTYNSTRNQYQPLRRVLYRRLSGGGTLSLVTNFTMASIPTATEATTGGSESKPWALPSAEEVERLVQNQRDHILPPDLIISGRYEWNGTFVTAAPTPLPPTAAPTPPPPTTAPINFFVRGRLAIAGITLGDWYRNEDEIRVETVGSIANAAEVRSDQVTILDVDRVENMPRRRRILQETRLTVYYEVFQLPTPLRSFHENQLNSL